MRIALLALLMACGPAEDDLAGTSAALETELLWVGDTHLRYDGYWIPSRLVMSDRALEVYTQTYPMGAAAEVRLFWADPAQTSIRSAVMSFDADRTGPFHQNTQWKTTIPSSDLPADQRVDYWVRAEDQSGRVLWDSRDGANYSSLPRERVELFDGASTECWNTAGPGAFSTHDGALHTHPRDGLGLYWCRYPTPTDYELTLEWSMTHPDDNSGVFIRFPDVEQFNYDNPAWVAVHFGHEIQIDEIARPDGADLHRTGAIYGESQLYTRRGALPPGEWNRYTIRVEGTRTTVHLNDQQTTRFDSTRSNAPAFVGLQSHSGTVRFRSVRLRAL